MAEKSTGEIRILLLEDSEIDAELMAGHLTKAEMTFSMQRVERQNDFLAALHTGSFDVILADYALPDFDGLSALRIAQTTAPDIPFIFVSGIVGEEFATYALKRGAIDYVLKRNLSRLAASVERAIAEAHERAVRRRAEEEVRELNATLEALVEARTAERDRIWRLSRDLFTVVDNAGRIQAINPAWARVLGYDDSAVVGRAFVEFAHPDDVTPASDFIASLAAGSPTERLEVRISRRDGEHRWISWTAVSEGNILYFVGRDITEPKAAAQKLAAANLTLKNEIAERERIEAAFRQMQRLEAVGQLTSGVAHDFNNLLTVILGNVRFLERGLKSLESDEKSRQRLSHIRAAAERGAKLTTQLLAFSRRQRLAPKTIDLNETIGSMRDLLQSTMGGSVKLEINLNAELWPALVDPTQLEMIVLNLAINARDAMDVGGRLTVETSNVSFREPPARPEDPAIGEYVCLTVKDTGKGMTPEVLAKAFEPFFTTKGPGKGSGLGLAQVYGSAKQSGGGVRIQTEPGKGTSVQVFLPRAQETSRPAAYSESAVASEGPGLGRTVLVVDDDNAVREVTSAALQELGYEVVEADGGNAALAILRQMPIDALVLDYAMPEMNGIDTAAAARAICPEVPIIFVTGYADLAAVKDVGERYVVQKPFRNEDLAAKLVFAMKEQVTGTGRVIPFAKRRDGGESRSAGGSP